MNTKSSHLFGIALDSEIRRTNMKLQMQIAKKNDGLSLRNLLHVLCESDTSKQGYFDQE